jgi:uncharacterized phage-associated protein
MAKLFIKTFSVEKVLQALFYLQTQLKTTNYMKLIKHVFFADRYHLRNYGTLLTYDNYCAMKFGPVCSQTYDILKEDDLFMDSLSDEERDIITNSIEKLDKSETRIKPQKENMLSQSEKEALDFSIEIFGPFNSFQLADITHDYPEWEKYKKMIESGRIKSADIDIVDFFNNPIIEDSKSLIKYLGCDPFVTDDDVLAITKEVYLKYA